MQSVKTQAAPAGRLRRIVWIALTYKRILFVLLIPLGLLLTALAAAFPHVVEIVYSRAAYRLLSSSIGRLFGLLPFSLAELLLYSTIAALVGYLCVQTARLIHCERRGPQLLRLLSNLCCAAGIGYFAFVLLCGLNYHRLSFAAQSGLAVRDSSAEEVAALYRELIETANELRPLVEEDENDLMRVSAVSSYVLAETAPQAYESLARQYPVFAGYAPRPKPVLFSRLMSACHLVGIYIPFTFEANFNRDIVAYNLPHSMLHELAHYKGFMREDEANFIAYLACRATDRPDFLYSGTMLALIHADNALYDADRDLYWETSALLSEAVRRDLAANNAYWARFKGPVAEAAQTVNDTYLKANHQADGVKSYGRMVDLLLADYRERHGLE